MVWNNRFTVTGFSLLLMKELFWTPWRNRYAPVFMGIPQDNGKDNPEVFTTLGSREDAAWSSSVYHLQKMRCVEVLSKSPFKKRKQLTCFNKIKETTLIQTGSTGRLTQCVLIWNWAPNSHWSCPIMELSKRSWVLHPDHCLMNPCHPWGLKTILCMNSSSNCHQ